MQLNLVRYNIVHKNPKRTVVIVTKKCGKHCHNYEITTYLTTLAEMVLILGELVEIVLI